MLAYAKANYQDGTATPQPRAGGMTRSQRQAQIAALDAQHANALSETDRAYLAAEPFARPVAEFGRATAHHAMSPLHGAAQAVQHGVQGLTNAATPAPQQNLSGLITGETPQARGALQQFRQYVNETVARDDAALQQRENQYQAQVPDSLASSAGAVAGGVVPFVVGGPAKLLQSVGSKAAGMLSRAPQAVQRLASGAAQGGLLGASQPVLEGDSRLQNTAVGGLLGAAGQGAADVVTRVGQRAAQAVTPQLRELARYGESVGLPLTGADIMQSEFGKRLASLTEALPLSGASSRAQGRSEQMGKQLAKLIGQDAPELNQEVMRRAYRDMGRQYDDFFADGMSVDDSFLAQAQAIAQSAQEGLDDTAIRAATTLARRAMEQVKDGRMSGDTLQSLDQQARKWATGGGDRQQVAQEFRDALHAAFSRQSSSGEAWRALNRKYANYKTLEPLIARNPEGVAPEQLLQAVNATKSGKARMARGEAGEIGDLALLGRQMRPPRTSKTPEGLLNLALGGGAAMAPAVAVPLWAGGNILGRVLNSPAFGRFLMREGRGQGAQMVAPYLRSGTPAAGLLAQDELDNPRKRP